MTERAHVPRRLISDNLLVLTFNLVLGLALSLRVAPSFALNLQQQGFTQAAHHPVEVEDQPVSCLTLSLRSPHRLERNCTFFKSEKGKG